MPVSVLIAPEFVLPPALEEEWLARLPPERRARLARWPDRRDRHRSLLGSRLLVIGLGRLGWPATVFASLRHPPGGRPTMALPFAGDFNISHCAGRVVCALSTEGAVGIDVEALGHLTAADFPHYLNPAERGWCGGSPRRFYRVWTRKEAVAKAAGTAGLPVLAGIDTMHGGRRALYAGRAWSVTAVPVGRGHVAHLATAAEDATVTFERLSRPSVETTP